MSQPTAGVPGTGNRITQPFRAAATGYRRAVNGVTRWRNTHRGTKTLKGMYAQAAKDAKRMDPTVRERIGRANMTKADLQSLAEAHITGAYDPRQRGYSRQLSGQATARAMTADQAVVRNRNPIRRVANTISRVRNTRQGTKALKGAYLQAKKDVGRMDPAVREAIGRSRITKADLQNLSQSAMQQTFRPEGRQTPYQVQPRFQQHLQAQARPQPQAQPQQQQQSPAQAQQPQQGQQTQQPAAQAQQTPAQQAPASAQPQQPAAQAQAQQAPAQQAPGQQPQRPGAQAQAQQAGAQQTPAQQQGGQQLDPEVHNVRKVAVQAAPPRPQMSPAEAAAAQQARQGQQPQQAPGQQPQAPGQQTPGQQVAGRQGQQAQQTAGRQGQQTGGQHRRGPGQHRQSGRAQQMAARYAALRQGSGGGRHAAGASHQAGQNQAPASARAQGQQGLNLRQRIQAVKQFHQVLSNQSPAQQAATAAQVNSQAAALQSPRTTGDAAKAFAGVAGAGGATAKPTSHRQGQQPTTAPTNHRNTDTKTKDPKLTR